MPSGAHRARVGSRARTILILMVLAALGAFAVVRLTSLPSSRAQAQAGPQPQTSATKAPGVDTEDAGDGAGKVKIVKAHPAESYPVVTGKRPIFLLLLGSDSRSKQPDAIAHGRADAIQLVGINPAEHRAGIIGFPRDSWVNIPGHGQNKINDAMFYGGPQGAVAQMESMTGIQIDYVVVGSFDGFRKMVSSLGGIRVDVPYAMNDSHAKIRVKAGPRLLRGKQALGFTRARYDVPGGDFGRSENQGLFLVSMLAQFRQQFAEDPSVVLRWMSSIRANIESDVPGDELMTLAFTVAEINPKQVRNVVVPGSIGEVGSESIVKLSSSAKALYADLKVDGYLKG